MKQKITESQLHYIIKESVRRILKEEEELFGEEPYNDYGEDEQEADFYELTVYVKGEKVLEQRFDDPDEAIDFADHNILPKYEKIVDISNEDEFEMYVDGCWDGEYDTVYSWYKDMWVD